MSSSLLDRSITGLMFLTWSAFLPSSPPRSTIHRPDSEVNCSSLPTIPLRCVDDVSPVRVTIAPVHNWPVGSIIEDGSSGGGAFTGLNESPELKEPDWMIEGLLAPVP